MFLLLLVLFIDLNYFLLSLFKGICTNTMSVLLSKPYLPAAGENADIIAIHEQLRKISDLGLGCKQFIKIFFRIELVQDDVLRRFVSHAMACEEHKDQVLEARVLLEPLSESFNESLCLFLRYVVLVYVRV